MTPDNQIPERAAQLVIGIPTFRRPEPLARLLDTLSAELAESETWRDRGVRVVVADNDSDPATRDLVRAHLSDVPSTVVDVAIPGYSEVRNALVRAALATPATEWLVLLDDDGLVVSPWLDPLLASAERLGADIIAGAVRHEVPPGSSRLARNSLFNSAGRPSTGLVPMLVGAQNVAIRRSALDAMPGPWFDPALGRTGGEDYEFHSRARALGLRMGRCGEAEVVEPTEVGRLTTRALTRRVFQSNRIGAHIDTAYHGTTGALRTTARHGWWTVRAVGAADVRREPDRLYEAALKALGVVGRLSAVTDKARGAGPRLARADRADRASAPASAPANA